MVPGYDQRFAAVEAANVVASALNMPVDLIKTNYGWGTLDGAILDPTTAKKLGLPAETKRALCHVGQAYGNLTGPLFQISGIGPGTPAKGVAALAAYDAMSATARVIVGAYVNPADPDPYEAYNIYIPIPLPISRALSLYIYISTLLLQYSGVCYKFHRFSPY